MLQQVMSDKKGQGMIMYTYPTFFNWVPEFTGNSVFLCACIKVKPIEIAIVRAQLSVNFNSNSPGSIY